MKREKKIEDLFEEESKLQSGMDTYLTNINNISLLTAEQERELAIRIKAGDRDARNQLVEANLRLVVNMARLYNGKGWHIDDLIEEGNLGLIKAADNYNISEGTRFSTYASYWINQAMHRAMINSSKLIRLPAYMVEIICKWRRAIPLLESELHRPPYSEEIARRIGLPRKRMSITLKALNAYKIAPPPDTPDGLGLEGIIADGRDLTPDDVCMEKNNLQKVHEELGHLSERESTVLKLRYGLIDNKEHTLRDVGLTLKITRERVRQISLDAIAKLRVRFD